MGRCWTSILCLVVFVIPNPGLGSVNTDRLRGVGEDGVREKLGCTLALQSGNARIDVRTGAHYAFATGELQYGIKNDAPFRDHPFGHLRYNYRLQPWLVAEAFTQLERDGFARLQLRSLAGAGLRVQYLDAEPLTIFQGTTPMYEHENLDGSALDQHPATTSTVRWSNYLNVRLHLSDSAHLTGTVYAQPRLDAFEDVCVLRQATLGVDLTEHLSFTAEFNLRYDRRTRWSPRSDPAQ